MPPKQLRLSRREIQAIFQNGRRTNTPHFSLIYTSEIKPGTTTRFAVLIPKSIDKRAVYRNRLRRLFYKSLEKIIPEFPAGHFVFQLRSSAQKLTPPQISNAIKSATPVQINQSPINRLT